MQAMPSFVAMSLTPKSFTDPLSGQALELCPLCPQWEHIFNNSLAIVMELVYQKTN
jgi:hypothetical protein